MAGNAPATVPTVTLENYTRDLLRCVKIDARSLTQTIQRLGGGDQGLQVLLSHIELWAKERMSANSIAERLESLSATLNASSSVEHALPSFSDNLNANPEEELIPYAITGNDRPTSFLCNCKARRFSVLFMWLCRFERSRDKVVAGCRSAIIFLS